MARLDGRLRTLKVGATFTSPPEVTLAAIVAEFVREAGGAATLEVQVSKPAGDFRPIVSSPEQEWAAGFVRVGDFVFRVTLVPWVIEDASTAAEVECVRERGGKTDTRELFFSNPTLAPDAVAPPADEVPAVIADLKRRLKDVLDPVLTR